MSKNILMSVFLRSTRYSCQIVKKFDFSRQIFEKYTNTELYKSGSVEAKLFHANGTDGRTDMTKPIVAFRSFFRTRPKIFLSLEAKVGES